ncbi:MAG: hypothetical protein JWN96_3903 [Mycobacterium sp.]|nr:hypothetical protein [Mycobacterium sp.]
MAPTGPEPQQLTTMRTEPIQTVEAPRPVEVSVTHEVGAATARDSLTVHIPLQEEPSSQVYPALSPATPLETPGAPELSDSPGVEARSFRQRISPTWRLVGRCLLVAIVAVAAFAGGLLRLRSAVQHQGAAAYLLAVLPAIALLLLQRSRPRALESNIHDRQIDYLVGLPFLGAALFILLAMPHRFGSRFWTTHADLVALPVFLAGAFKVTFGTRAMWRLRYSLLLCFCVLLPYPEGAISDLAKRLADGGLAVVRIVGVALVGWSVPPGSPTGTFAVKAGNPTATVSFAGAMTGAAGLLACVAVVVLLAATGVGWRGAVRRALLVAAVWVFTIAVRFGVAFAVGAASGPADARLVLGSGGDGVTLAVLFAALATLVFFADRKGSGEERAARRLPVQRAGAALTLTIATGTALCLLGTR